MLVDSSTLVTTFILSKLGRVTEVALPPSKVSFPCVKLGAVPLLPLIVKLQLVVSLLKVKAQVLAEPASKVSCP